MPGALLWGYYLTDKKWIPLQVDENGLVKVDVGQVNLDDLGDVSVAAPTDGYVLYWDDATSLWKCKAMPWTPQIYTTQIPWVSLDGFTQTTPAGSSIIIAGFSVLPRTGAVANNNCGLFSTFQLNTPLPAGKEMTVEFPINYLKLLTNQRATMLFMNHNAYPPTETRNHVGFIINNGDLYSSSADGTTQETQDTGIDLGTGNQLTLCRAVVIGGVSAKFYVNNVLKTTHTTNVPLVDTAGLGINIGITTLDAVDKWIGVERILITREL